jgi:hypothetical protein
MDTIRRMRDEARAALGRAAERLERARRAVAGALGRGEPEELALAWVPARQPSR